MIWRRAYRSVRPSSSRPIGFAMDRRMLMGIKARSERMATVSVHTT